MKYLLVALSFIGGCGGDRPTPSRLGDKAKQLIEQQNAEASTLWDYVALYGSGLAGLGMLIGIVMLWMSADKKKAMNIIGCSVSVLIGAQLMLWVSANLAWITIILVVISVSAVGYKYREEIKDAFDDDETVKIESKK